MLRDAAVDLIMKRLGNRTSTNLQQQIINEMVLAQETVLEGGDFLPWFLLSETSTASNTVDDERLALPTDFIMEWEEGALWRYDAAADVGYQWLEMDKDDYDIIKTKYPGSGIPTHYDTVYGYFLLRPIPDDTYTWKMKYFAKGADLSGVYGDSNNVENVWLENASDWFIGEVGAVIAAEHLQSDKLAASFVAQATRGKNRVMTRHIAWVEMNKSRQMGDS